MSVAAGVVLAVIGVAGYVLTGMVSPTALIPAAFGIALFMLGLYGVAPERRRTAMHMAMGVSLAGIIGSMSGLADVLRSLVAGTGLSGVTAASQSKAAMAAVLIVYLALGVRSFMGARR